MGLGVVWILGALAVQSGTYRIRMEVQRSAILQRLNTVLPPSGPLLNSLRRLDPFPRIDGPEARVAPPQRRDRARSRRCRRPPASVVKILGTACGLGVAGSGWVAGDGLVVTNAHVVAGERDTRVLLRRARAGPARAGGLLRPAQRRRDPAGRRARRARRSPLAARSRAGTSAAILGFPLNGPFDVRAGRLGRHAARAVLRRVRARPGGALDDRAARARAVRATRAGRWSTARAGSSRRSSPPRRAGRAAATACRTRWCAARSATPAARCRPAPCAGLAATLAAAMGKTLVIAEKPSVGRDLSRVLPGAFQKHEGYLETDDHIMTWAVGHLVQLAEPDEYDPKFKKWRMADLPIVPDAFKLVVRDERSKKQMSVITKLLKRDDVDRVVNACDAGREGELIFAWTFEKANAKKPVERLWLSSMTTAAIKQALGDLRPRDDFARLEEAARSRSEADWIVGMNATRAATIRLRSSFDGAVSLGRVQTPTLALIARREEEIRAFKPEAYWLVDARFEPTGGEPGRRYAGRYHAGAQPRMKTAAEAEAIVAAVRGRTGEITKLEKSTKKERAPLLYDLTSLQREANTRFGFSARRTLAAAQRLYEEHKALTYPRTNSRFLTGDMAGEIKPTAELVGKQREYARAAAYVTGLDTLPLGRVVNDAKVTDHHAIIPTKRRAPRRQDVRRRPARLRHGRAPLPRRLPPRRRVREHAPRDDGRGARVPHARPRAGRAGLARRLRRGLRGPLGRRRRRGHRPGAAEARAGRGRPARSRSARRRRRPSRRGATPTRRCSPRWRPPASSSTTTSCARR